MDESNLEIVGYHRISACNASNGQLEIEPATVLPGEARKRRIATKIPDVANCNIDLTCTGKVGSPSGNFEYSVNFLWRLLYEPHV